MPHCFGGSKQSADSKEALRQTATSLSKSNTLTARDNNKQHSLLCALQISRLVQGGEGERTPSFLNISAILSLLHGLCMKSSIPTALHSVSISSPLSADKACQGGSWWKILDGEGGRIGLELEVGKEGRRSLLKSKRQEFTGKPLRRKQTAAQEVYLCPPGTATLPTALPFTFNLGTLS